MVDFDIMKHVLVPEHKKISEDEKKDLLKKYNLSLSNLPMILLSDAAIQGLKPEVGDVIRIKRKSPTTISSYFYRVVVHG